MAEQVADLTGIKVVEQGSAPIPAQTRPAVYEIPMYQKMTAKDGTQVDILVQTIRTTKDQLQGNIDRFNEQIADLQGKLDAIIALEASQVKVG